MTSLDLILMKNVALGFDFKSLNVSRNTIKIVSAVYIQSCKLVFLPDYLVSIQWET